MSDEMPASVLAFRLLREQQAKGEAFSEQAVCELLDGIAGTVEVEDMWASQEMQDFADDVHRDMLPKLQGSAITISLVPGNAGDVKFWVELGAAIMLDKPILSVVLREDDDIPTKLRMVSDEIVVMPDGLGSDEAQEELKSAIGRMLKKIELNRSAVPD